MNEIVRDRGTIVTIVERFNFRSFTRCLSRKGASIAESASFQKHLFALERIGLRQELGHNRMILEKLDGIRPSVTRSKETRILNHARISLYPPPPSIASLLPSFLRLLVVEEEEEEESLDGDETGLLER